MNYYLFLFKEPGLRTPFVEPTVGIASRIELDLKTVSLKATHLFLPYQD